MDELNRFPPRPRPQSEGSIELLRASLRTALEPRSAGYIATEVTSGRRFARWYAEVGHALDPESAEYRNRRHDAVVAPNVKEGLEHVRAIRARYDRVFIEPLSLDVPEWSQDDYRYFWARVIEEFVDTVILLDGWWCSNGAAFEFLAAVQSGCVTLAEDGSPLGIDKGRELVERGIAELEGCGVTTRFLSRVAFELEEIAAAGGQP